MGRSLHRSLLRLALIAGLAAAAAVPAFGQATSYKLLDNASASGQVFFPQSGNYLLHLTGTFGGATVALVQTQNSGGAITSLGSWTSAPASDPCIAIPAGVQVQMTVTGGSPSALFGNLGGVGAGGCPNAGGGADPVGVKNASGTQINPATTTTDTNTGAVSTTLGAKTDAKSTATDGTSVSAMQVWKQLSASLQALVASAATTSTDTNTGAVSTTLGAKTDAKNTATDGTSVSAMQVLKQISASMQALAASAATTTTDTNTGAVSTAIGSKTDAKSTATDTTSVSAMQVWKQISASVQAAATASNQSTANSSLSTIGTNTGTSATAAGAPADTAYAGSGSASIIAALKGIYAQATGSIPAGNALIGKVGIDQTTPGTTDHVSAALLAGSAKVGQVAIDQTTPGTTDHVSAVLLAGTAKFGQAAIDQTTPGTTNAVQLVPGTSNGLSVLSKQVANNTTSFAVDASAGMLYGVEAFNNSTTIAYIKLYNAAQGSTTCGSGTPIWRGMIPAPSAGGGGFLSLSDLGIPFSTAITACVTAGFGDSDTTSPAANTYIINFKYK